MSLLPLKKALVASILSAFIFQVSATPIAVSNGQYAEHAMRKRANLEIRATTITESSTIDWIPIGSQADKIASPPPARSPKTNGTKPMAELQHPGAQLGPPGTVPIPQVSPEYLATVEKKTLPHLSSAKSKRQYSGVHWYVSSDQSVNSHGGSATYSLFNAYVQSSGDFSLLQTAVTKQGVNGGQTLEAGWINYPNQVSRPHLFTYFTTDGYVSTADNRGGWNQDVKGWVQVDTTIFPGTVFQTSAIGGTQYEMEISYLLYQGNWWLYVLDRYIGYYPATLFSNGISGSTLATGSDLIYYYGEIYNSENAQTTTDMGSGKFGETGFGNSAYIHNMVYFDTNGNAQDYTAGFSDSDTGRYDHVATPSSGSNWGSYVYLGGPGAGGVLNG